MPCTYDGPDDVIRNNQKAKQTLDKLTDMLCRLCQNCESETEKLFDPDILEWWNEHKKIDEKREAEEVKSLKEFIRNAQNQQKNTQKQIEKSTEKLEQLLSKKVKK